MNSDNTCDILVPVAQPYLSLESQSSSSCSSKQSSEFDEIPMRVPNTLSHDKRFDYLLNSYLESSTSYYTYNECCSNTSSSDESFNDKKSITFSPLVWDDFSDDNQCCFDFQF